MGSGRVERSGSAESTLFWGVFCGAPSLEVSLALLSLEGNPSHQALSDNFHYNASSASPLLDRHFREQAQLSVVSCSLRA